jgi:methionyl-tRNA formyltransferase
MRVVFFGSGAFAVPVVRALASSPHELVQIVTQPARPAGRGGKLRPTPVAQAAGELGREVVECADVNAPEAVADVTALTVDVICVADFGQMVREPMRTAARLGAFNMHGSVLPELRGAAPMNWAIIRGYTQTGVTTFDMVDGMDAGDVYLIRTLGIAPHETLEELKPRMADLGAQVVLETLDGLASGTLAATPQDHSQKTLAPKLTKADGLIDWHSDAVTIRNLIHGTWPWPGGHAILRRSEGKDVEVTIARVAVVDEGEGTPGVFDDDLLVGTGQGRLRILQVKPAGKRLMDWTDFANGCRVAAGDCLVRPEGH